MRVISSIEEFNKIRTASNVKPVGLVPTMGALHEGHISLVRKALDRCALTVVSIYVNPTQFNDMKDLKNYPRTIEKDLELLGKVMRKDDIVFTPEDKEIYPEKDTRVFDFGNLDKPMEGLSRPGHFNGVGQIISKLFAIINPDIAFFGQKDFQQLTIIRELVRQSGSKIEITGCEIVREADGLAMSSRNRLLKPGIRQNAGIIYETISKAALMIKNKEIDEIKKFVFNSINRTMGFKTIYFEIVDNRKLVPVTNRMEMSDKLRYYGCIAVIAGDIRLIDNIEISLY
jgi:pantoate--beta-alanine ligase